MNAGTLTNWSRNEQNIIIRILMSCWTTMKRDNAPSRLVQNLASTSIYLSLRLTCELSVLSVKIARNMTVNNVCQQVACL